MIGTMNILAACGGPDSPVTKVVFKSSAHYYGCERDDPSFFTEEMRRPHEPHTRLESDIVEADDAVQGFAARNPKVTVTTLRFCNGLGPDLRTSHSALLGLPAVPGILGFDPRYQFIHEDDIVGVLHHAATHDLDGHPQRGAGRRPGAERDRVAARQAVRADPAAVRRPASASAPPGWWVLISRPRSSASCDMGAVSTTASSSSPATASASRRARRSRHLPLRCG